MQAISTKALNNRTFRIWLRTFVRFTSGATLHPASSLFGINAYLFSWLESVAENTLWESWQQNTSWKANPCKKCIIINTLQTSTTTRSLMEELKSIYQILLTLFTVKSFRFLINSASSVFYLCSMSEFGIFTCSGHYSCDTGRRIWDYWTGVSNSKTQVISLNRAMELHQWVLLFPL